MLFRSTVLATVAVALLSTATDAHSWVDCMDWRFKDPSKPSFAASGGSCYGWARKYPLKANVPFGKLDSYSPNRHYQQNPADFTPCSDGIHGIEPGGDETRQNPISKSYGGSWGTMTTATVGKQLCLRWPAKNHAVPSEPEHGVTISMPPTAVTKDPTQSQFTSFKIATLKYKNCNDIPGDTDTTPCGDCFTIPQRASGNYVIQWRWQLNPNEFYTSCADIAIINPADANNSTSNSTTGGSGTGLSGQTTLFADLAEDN